MGGANGLDRKGPDGHEIPGGRQPLEAKISDSPLLAQPAADQFARVVGGIHRNIVPLQQVRQRPDMILVPMCQDNAQEVAAIGKESEIGNHDVDSEVFFSGKHDAGVYNDALRAVSVEHHVHPELTEPAQRDDL
jgi:hypothetical protein